MRGLGINDEGAAATDVTDPTEEITRYELSSEFNHIQLFDVPGYGALGHSAKNYFMLV